MIENKFWKYTFYAVILIVLQFSLFDHMILWSDKGIVPYVYILFILLLPRETDRRLLIILGFVYGLAIDLGEGSLGVNAAATTAIAFFRTDVLNGIQPRHGYEANTPLSFYSYGQKWVILYFLLMTAIHQTIFFILADFHFSFVLLLKIVLNTFYTVAMALLVHLLLLKNKV